MTRKAFTLIELLVVIAIIAILMGILMPALQLVRRKAAVTTCMSNTRNLSMGWYMYMQSNDDKIMSANDSQTEPGGNFVGWIGIPETEDGTKCGITQTTPVTDEDEIRGIKLGRLFSYVQDPKAYHCVADRVRKSLYDGTRVFVSYSIPRCLYGYANPSSSMYSKEIRRFGQIRRPATRYNFVETAEMRNWNSGHHFVMAAPEYTGVPNEWGWWGPMAINHGDSSVLGYCDGHSQVRKWRDRYTIDRVDKLWESGSATYGQQYPPDNQQSDIKFMADGWAYRGH